MKLVLSSQRTSLKDQKRTETAPLTKNRSRNALIVSDENSEKNSPKYPNIDNDIEQDDREEFVMNKNVADRVNRSKKHPYVEVGENVYCVGCYGYKPLENIWEPISQIPMRKVISYFNRKKTTLPVDLDNVIDGYRDILESSHKCHCLSETCCHAFLTVTNPSMLRCLLQQFCGRFAECIVFHDDSSAEGHTRSRTTKFDAPISVLAGVHP